MTSVSLAIITLNEEVCLPRVLADVDGLVDEIVIGDTGSTDQTIPVATRELAKMAKTLSAFEIIAIEWKDDYSAARNEVLDACHGDWIMVLDADDHIPDPARMRKVIDRLDEFTEADAIVMPYRVGDTSTNNARFIRRSAGLRYSHRVHEDLNVQYSRGIVVIPDVEVIHARPDQEYVKFKHLPLLERAYAEGDRSHHMIFYLAREVQAKGDGVRAFGLWEEYFETTPAERAPHFDYIALLMMADGLDTLFGGLASGQGKRMEAALIDPSRPEAWFMSGCWHQVREQWAAAEPFFRAALGCRRPALGFQIELAYTWGPHDGLGVCLANEGRNEEALEHFRLAEALGADEAENIAEMRRLTDQQYAMENRDVERLVSS